MKLRTSVKDEITMDTTLTTYQVGAMLQVNPSSVNKWAKDGRIQHHKTPGGHRRIVVGQLVEFVKAYEMRPLEPLKSFISNNEQAEKICGT